MMQYVGQKCHKTFLTLPILIEFRHKNKSYNMYSYYITCHIFSILIQEARNNNVLLRAPLLHDNTFKVGISTTSNGAYALIETL